MVLTPRLPSFGNLPQRPAEPWAKRMNPGIPADDMGADPNPEQARLMRAMAQGDKQALAALYDGLAKPLYALAYRVLNDSTEAQDIVHDVFVQMWLKAASYETSRGTVFTWAATLTRNRAIDRVRTRKRRAELLTAFAPELHPGGLEENSDSAASLWLQQKATTVRTALSQLAPDQKNAIELAFFSGWTQQQIADKLNEPLGTIKARIRRGLLKLREVLPAEL